MDENREHQRQERDYADAECSRITVVALREAIKAGNQPQARRFGEQVASDLLKRLRRIVGTGHPNKGEDIIEDAFQELFTGVLKLGSTVGQALEEHYTKTVRRRALDALKRSKRYHERHVLVETYKHDEIFSVGGDNKLAPWNSDPLSDGLSIEEIDSLLSTIKDERKRLVFRLHMDENGMSDIAMAIGKDPKTVKTWLEQVRDILKREIKRRDGI